MITYKIDKQPNTTVNTQIRDMGVVLAEIPKTLRVLLDLLATHESAISAPSINNFRYELEKSVEAAIDNTTSITDLSQKLSAVSEQAGKHLAAVEEHFGSVLRDNPTTARREAPVA
jgi:hypothetical protein